MLSILPLELLPEHHDAFVVVDADSEVLRTSRDMTWRSAPGRMPSQCRYFVRNSGDSVADPADECRALAFNVLRPRGRDRLGLSAGIYGNGFALSAGTLRAVPYTAASVVEDLEFHLALVRALAECGSQSMAVYGDMPVAGAGVKTQRARWEGGRFRMMARRRRSLLGEVLKGPRG